MIEHLFGETSADRRGFPTHGASNDKNLHTARVQQFGGNVHSVGDDLQSLHLLHLPGDFERRGARIQDDGFAIVDQRNCHGADAPLLVGVRLQAFLHWRFAQNLIREDCPAMRAQHQPALMQFIQVVTDGDCRGVKPFG